MVYDRNWLKDFQQYFSYMGWCIFDFKVKQTNSKIVYNNDIGYSPNDLLTLMKVNGTF